MIDLHFLCVCLIDTALLLVIFFDFVYFQIPNIIVGALFGLFFAMNPTFSLASYTIPAVILVIGFLLAIPDILGFGDSKLLAVLSFGLASHGHGITGLLLGTIFMGGAAGLIFLVFNKRMNTLRACLIRSKKINAFASHFVDDINNIKKEIKSGVYDRYMPYGIPISLVGIVLLAL